MNCLLIFDFISKSQKVYVGQQNLINFSQNCLQDSNLLNDFLNKLNLELNENTYIESKMFSDNNQNMCVISIVQLHKGYLYNQKVRIDILKIQNISDFQIDIENQLIESSSDLPKINYEIVNELKSKLKEKFKHKDE